LEDRIAKAEAIIGAEEKARQEAEKAFKKAAHEKEKLIKELEEERSAGTDFQERFNKIQSGRQEVERQLDVRKFNLET